MDLFEDSTRALGNSCSSNLKSVPKTQIIREYMDQCHRTCDFIFKCVDGHWRCHSSVLVENSSFYKKYIKVREFANQPKPYWILFLKRSKECIRKVLDVLYFPFSQVEGSDVRYLAERIHIDLPLCSTTQSLSTAKATALAVDNKAMKAKTSLGDTTAVPRNIRDNLYIEEATNHRSRIASRHETHENIGPRASNDLSRSSNLYYNRRPQIAQCNGGGNRKNAPRDSTVFLEYRYELMEPSTPLFKGVINSQVSITNNEKFRSSCGDLANGRSDWDPMMEDYLSCGNRYGRDLRDAGVLTFGYKAKDYDNICRHYRSRGFCKYGYDCIYKHPSEQQLAEYDQKEIISRTIELSGLRPGTTFQAIITNIESPYSFFVVILSTKDINFKRHLLQSHYDIDIFREMIQEMTLYYSRMGPEDMEQFPAIGSLVAVKDDDVYYRAVVVSFNFDDCKCLVKNIDTGAEYVVERIKVYDLAPRFAMVPTMALQCRVSGIAPSGNNYQWSERALTRFCQLALGAKFEMRIERIDRDDRIWLVPLSKDDFRDILIGEGLAVHT